MAVDPEQWRWVKRIHYGYAQRSDGGRQSTRRLADELAGEGFEMSTTRIREILHDPIYVTGEWTSAYKGRLIRNKPIALSDPIPIDIFATPVGTFVLNGIKLLHARCMDKTVTDRRNGKPVGIQPTLKGREFQRKHIRNPAYYHYPRVPDCCHRYTLTAADVDKVVVGELRRLASCAELRAAFEKAQRYNTAPGSEIWDESKVAAEEDRLARLIDAKKRLETELIDLVASDDKDGLAEYRRRVAAGVLQEL